MGDISNINNEISDDEEAEIIDLTITNGDEGRTINVRGENDELIKGVDVFCNFTNSIVVGPGEIPYKNNPAVEEFTYTVFEHNQNVERKLAGFSAVNYKLKYPDNGNTTLIDIEGDQPGAVVKALKLNLSQADIINKYIGFHDGIIIPLITGFYKQKQSVTQTVWNALKNLGKNAGKIAMKEIANYLLPYSGSVIGGLIEGGGSVTRNNNLIEWSNPEGSDNIEELENVSNNRSIRLFKNDETPVEVNGQIDYVRRDMVDVKSNNTRAVGEIEDDEEEPIWAGSTNANIDILDNLEVTLTDNNDTFEFDIDQYCMDPVVLAAPDDAPRPIGIKKVTVHTNIPPTIPEMDSENPVNIQTNGTYGIQYDDSSNELSIVPTNNNRSVNNVGTFDVNVPSTPTQTKSVSYGTNGSYTVQPDSGYNLSSVSVDVSVPTTNITQITNYPITQNGVQTVPIPTGYDAVDSISLDVSIPNKIYITSIKYENQIHSLSSFSIRGSETSVSVPTTKMLVIISVFSNYVYIKCLVNGTSNAASVSFVQNTEGPTYYITTSNPDITAYTTAVSFLDSNNNVIFNLYDNYVQDGRSTEGHFYRSFFEFVFN